MNTKRQANKIRKALAAIYDPYDMAASITDALTDIRHLCDLRGLDFADLDRQAYDHYSPERS